MALNGGPLFKFTPAISLFVILEDEAAVDRLWEGLSDGGTVLMPLDKYDWSERYGWLADRWGLNWQIALGKHADTGRTVTPSLLFGGKAAGQAEAAIELYTSAFPGATRGRDPAPRRQRQGRRRHGHARPVPHRRPGGHGHGQRRGRRFAFNEAVSLLVNCEDQAEIDRLWSALSAVPAGGGLRLAQGPLRRLLADRAARARRDDDLGRPGRRSSG